jgi:hypothetical protein
VSRHPGAPLARLTALPLPRIFNPMVVDAVVKKGTVVSATTPPKVVDAFSP